MWLINTSTLQLELFTPPTLPRYAILSHTWGDDEVGFSEFRNQRWVETTTTRGLAKIRMTCRLARDRGIPYAWVDTCCIDKSSSAELSEAINSMFGWYRRSAVCFAFVEDWGPRVQWAELCSLMPEQEDGETSSDLDADAVLSEANPLHGRFFLGKADFVHVPGARFREVTPKGSGETDLKPLKWFTRGWTLQELIAPTAMEFYDASWGLRGVKKDPLVVGHLSRITGIGARVLGDGSESELRSVSVGQRMSWAAYRETSRVEDIAYCLLGIFQVNMPMLYGEGSRAFTRLQEEIIKSSTDLSIFAWCQDGGESESEYRGILACHPREFKGLRECELVQSQLLGTEEITISNKGLRLHTSLFYRYNHDNGVILDGTDVQFMYLGCEVMRKPQGIFLKRMHDVYVRAEPKCWIEISMHMRRGEAHTIHLARDMDQGPINGYIASFADGARLKLPVTVSYLFRCTGAWPPGFYDHWFRRVRVPSRKYGMSVGLLRFKILGQRTLQQRLLQQPAQARALERKVGSFTLISVNNWWYFANEAQAAVYEAQVNAVWYMDPVTAEAVLTARLRTLLKDALPEIIVSDASANALLHITVPKINASVIECSLGYHKLNGV